MPCDGTLLVLVVRYWRRVAIEDTFVVFMSYDECDLLPRGAAHERAQPRGQERLVLAERQADHQNGLEERQEAKPLVRKAKQIAPE